MNALLAFLLVFSMGLKVPFGKINHPSDDVVNRFQDNVERALGQMAGTTLDHWNDGTLFKRVLGVDSTNRVTSSGIALHTVVDANMASGTLTSASIASGTVTVANLAPAGQFSVYRNAAFSLGAGATLPLIADRVVKDASAGYSQTDGTYTIPSAGDWWFAWSAALTATNAGKEVFSALVINSGSNVNGSVGWSQGASQYLGSVGSFLYCNAVAGEKVQVRLFNGDTAVNAMAVGSGANFFTGYRVR